MKKIKKLILTQLRNDEYYQYMSDSDKLMLEASLEALGIIDKYDAFKSGLNRVDKALKVELGSSQTKFIRDADELRDKLDRGFDLQVESYLNHWDADVVESARRINRIIKQHGIVRVLSYNEESGALSNKMQELQSTEYAADLEKLNLSLWAEKIVEANESFKTFFSSRANKEASRVSGNTQAARAALSLAYKEIVIRINALVVVNGEASYATFIDKINYYIDYYKTTIAARKSRNEKDNSDKKTKE